MLERHGLRRVTGPRRRTRIDTLPDERTGTGRGSRSLAEEAQARWRPSRAWRELSAYLGGLPTAERILTTCAHCGVVRMLDGSWVQLPDGIREEFRTHPEQVVFSHGICPPCLTRHYSEYLAR